MSTKKKKLPSRSRILLNITAGVQTFHTDTALQSGYGVFHHLHSEVGEEVQLLLVPDLLDHADIHALQVGHRQGGGGQ